MRYYTYIYYDENWQAYYVGKGAGQRFYAPRGFPIPPRERIQRFFFDEEWQSIECEMDLIAFFGRQIDGGSLLNQTIGGRGGSLGLKGKHHYNSKTYELTSTLTAMNTSLKGSLNFAGSTTFQRLLFVEHQPAVDRITKAGLQL